MTSHHGSDESEAQRPRLVRAYTITAGRTHTAVDLPMEATLRLQPGRDGRGLAPASAQVLEVCDRRSVAEVSALAKMPLGDLLEQGIIRIQATITEQTSKDERLELIERTLRGLRNY